MMTDTDFDLFKSWLIITTAIAYRDAERAERSRSVDRLTRWGEFYGLAKVLGKVMDVKYERVVAWMEEESGFQLEVMVDQLRRKFRLQNK